MDNREVLIVADGEVRAMNERELQEHDKDAIMPWFARLIWPKWSREETARILEDDRVRRVEECAKFEVWKTELHARLRSS